MIKKGCYEYPYGNKIPAWCCKRQLGFSYSIAVPAENATTEWLEPVDDEYCSKLEE